MASNAVGGTEKRARSTEPEGDAGAPDAKAPRVVGGAVAAPTVDPDKLLKTLLCKYFKKGKCTKGDKCGYAHAEKDLRRLPDGEFHTGNAAILAEWKRQDEEAAAPAAGGGATGAATAASAPPPPASSSQAPPAAPAGAATPVGDTSPEAMGLGSGGSVCVQNLPRNWDQDHFGNFLKGLGVANVGCRKKRGLWTYGFVTFAFLRDREAAVRALQDLPVEGTPITVADASQSGPGGAGAGAAAGFAVAPSGKRARGVCNQFRREGRCKFGDRCKFSHGGDQPPPAAQADPGAEAAPRDIRDKVSPLWRLPYHAQLVRKRAGIATILKRITRKARKQMSRKEPWPQWLAASKTNGGLCAPLEGILRSPEVGGYRNKCEFSIGPGVDGKPRVGFLLGSFKDGVTAVAQPTGCRHIPLAARTLAAAVESYLESSELPTWDKRVNKGFWRLLLVRTGGQVAARAAQSGQGEPPSYQEFVVVPGDLCGNGGEGGGGAEEGGAGPESEAVDDAEGGGAGAGAAGAGAVVPESEAEAAKAEAEQAGELQEERETAGPQEVMAVVQVNPEGADPELVAKECAALASALQVACAAAVPPIPLKVCLKQLHHGCSNAAPDSAPLLPMDAGPDGEGGAWVESSIHDVMCGLKFSISPSAFFQVNTAAAEMLYRLAGDWVAASERALLFDVCCGTGTIGLTLARRVARVIGIDICAPAIEDARRNAEINGITNCEFVCGKAEETMDRLLRERCAHLPPATAASAEEGGAKDEAGAKEAGVKEEAPYTEVVAIVDPPRCGLHHSVLRALRQHARLRRLVYVSCNPETLASNALDLCKPGGKGMPGPPFRPVRAMAVDLFPHTVHCEAVIMFER